jgi:hypothetical protein
MALLETCATRIQAATNTPKKLLFHQLAQVAGDGATRHVHAGGLMMKMPTLCR